jgi:hypothetical protein
MPPDLNRGEPLSGVVITSREIYDAVVRLTGRVDVLIQQQAGTESHTQDLEARMRNVERRLWPLPSAALVLSLVGIAITVIPQLP